MNVSLIWLRSEARTNFLERFQNFFSVSMFFILKLLLVQMVYKRLKNKLKILKKFENFLRFRTPRNSLDYPLLWSLKCVV